MAGPIVHTIFVIVPIGGISFNRDTLFGPLVIHFVEDEKFNDFLVFCFMEADTTRRHKELKDNMIENDSRKLGQWSAVGRMHNR